MTGTRAFKLLEPFEFVIAIDNLEGDGAAKCNTLPDACENVDGIGFELLATASAVASLTQSQFVVDHSSIYVEARRKAIKHG